MADGTPRTRRQVIVSAVAVVLVAIVGALLWLIDTEADTDSADADTASATSSTTTPATSSAGATSAGDAGDAGTSTRTSSSTTAVPAHVLATLTLIDSGDWPEAANAPGTRGGTVFRNNERNLPVTGTDGRRITYREWDVNAKEPGRSRDAERIVTGSDGTAWYTDDHYRTFVRIRGPNR
ncbi:ribonuclease domain-containing protein [Gordonia sp. OPL2]|uniref:ribonuclease domain-containing protein n=1 Tax=Gordonia sp. OPL2 TaxID=2486274 RepID=UPI0016557342|nr:ribonuclease domain-containing protein [Gordonia sp. OPL2]ROZ99362.1 ribonuclease N [Gordonia sp. OPL2]